MGKRKIIKIDEEKCNGCGLCVPNCQEGALQMIDGKARLISDLFCDGLGACIGHCPEGAIEIIEREAEPYDERKVMEENIVPKGKNTIKAHMSHLKDHGAKKYLKIAEDYLEEKGVDNPLLEENKMKESMCGCPGAKMMDFKDKDNAKEEQENSNAVEETGKRSSQLRQWPVQLHLVSPEAPYYENADVLLAADCTAYALADFHKDFMKEKSIAIACPKLDSNLDIYVDKIASMIDNSKINTLTVAIMQVPCCAGLVSVAQEGASKAERKIPIKKVVVGIQGDILEEGWL